MVTDEAGNSATAEITLTAVAVYGLENLDNLQLRVGVKANLMTGLTIADGLTLQKIEVIQDGIHTGIENPKIFTPEYPGDFIMILTLSRPDGSTIEVSTNILSVKPLEYHNMPITNIKPETILPVISQVESGDKNVYDHIDHLMVAEATRIRDMMWQYGAGNHTPVQYQKLMLRLHTGMLEEYPQ